MAKTFKYFAFGSNLLRERILINNATAKFISKGTLYGYKLTFDYPVGLSVAEDGWMGAGATIRSADPDTYVIGCIWEINLDQVDRLDRQEMYYFPMEVEVETDIGDKVMCRTYQMQHETTGTTLPNRYYVKVIVDGARQHDFPEDYVKIIESQAVNEHTEPPRIYLDVMRKIKEFREAQKENEDAKH